MVQSNAIALFCYLAEDMVIRTGCVNAVVSEFIKEAKLKFSSYPDAVNNIATIESSVPTKATLNYYPSCGALLGDGSNSVDESDSGLKMFRHTLTQRKLKPKAPGLLLSYLKIKKTQPRYSASMFPFYPIHPFTVRDSYQRAPSQVY